MKGIDELATKALELRESGMNDKEIARELHLSENTIVWLLTRGVEKKSPPVVDVKIGWTSAGVFGHRISYLANILSDIIIEEAENRDFELDTVVGIAINGIPLATNISDELGLEFAMFRPPHNKEGPGSLASNFANVDGKAVVLVDDVIDTGETMSHAIEEIKKMGGVPKLVLVLVNKSEMVEICDVPLRSIIRARAIY
jgi:orotate phosphoribosyltransferase